MLKKQNCCVWTGHIIVLIIFILYFSIFIIVIIFEISSTIQIHTVLTAVLIWVVMWCCVIWVCSLWHFRGTVYQTTRCHIPEDCNLCIQIIKNLKPYILVFLSRHSLLATRLVSEMNEELGLQLSISDMLQHCTVQSMASFIENPTVNKAGVNIDLRAVVDMHSQDKAPWVALL